MKVEVITRNGQSNSFHPSTNPQCVELEITAQEVKEGQERSMVGIADTACRIKMVDEDGDFSWFAITPIVKNGRPSVELQWIGTVDETVKKKVTGKWRKKPEEAGV